MRRVDTLIVHVASSVGRQARRPVWLMLSVFLGVVATALLAVASTAQATTTYKVTIQGTSGVKLRNTTCSEALTTLESQTPNSSYTLKAAPSHFPKLDVTTVTITPTSTSTCTSLVLKGTGTVFSQKVTVLDVATWTSNSATSPTFMVAIRFATVGLDQLLTVTPPTGTGVSGTFAHVWLTATTASTTTLTLTKTATTGTPAAVVAAFFTGFHGTTVTVPGTGKGLGFAGVLASTGSLATGLGRLGVSNVQVSGQLAASLSTVSSFSTPPVSGAGFSVTASFGLRPANLPTWLSLPTGTTGTAFALTIAGTTHGWSVDVTGHATVILPPSTTATRVTVDFSVSQAKAATPVKVGVTVTVGNVTTAFGLSWLKLTTASVSGTFSKAAVTGTLRADLTLSTGLALKATVTLSSTGGATVALSLTTSTKTLSTSSLATDMHLTLPAGAPTVSLSHLDLYLAVPKGGTVTIAAQADATLTIKTVTIAVSVLVRYQGGQLIVGAETTTAFTLHELVRAITQTSFMNFALTHLAVVFTNKSTTLKSATLDAPTKAFFQPLYCTAGTTCPFTAKVEGGVSIQAAVALPTAVKTAVCKLLTEGKTCLSGPVTIDGHIPLFTSTSLSLTLALPALYVTTGAVRRVTLGMSLAVTAKSHKVALSASGKLLMLVPSSYVTQANNGSCPVRVVRTSTPGTASKTEKTDICLTLDLIGSLKAGPTGVTLTFTFGITAATGWRLPSPVTWLTIEDLKGQIGVTAGEGVGLTFGVTGKFRLGQTTGTTFGMALDVEVMPEAPWVNLLGFKVESTTGIGKTQIAALYDAVTGTTLTPSILPPVALKDLLFEYALKSDAQLGLCQGLYISANLVITNGKWPAGTTSTKTPVTCATTTLTTTPSRSTACATNSKSCLASVLLEISKTGFVGYGHLTGWSAGPLSFTPTTLDVTITKTEQEIHISGGGKLLTPLVWLTTKTTSPTMLAGTLTLTVGTSHLHLSGSGTVGTLHGTFAATGSEKTLQNAFSTVSTWFTTTVTGALKTAATHIKTAMTTVSTTASGWYTTYVATTGNQVVSDIQGAFTTLGTTSPPSWVTLETIFTTITTAISTWNTAVETLTNKSHTITFLLITSQVIFHDVLTGLHITGWKVCTKTNVKCTTLIPGLTIPGLCSGTYGSFTTIASSPLCVTTTDVAGAQKQYANPTVTSHLASATLTLPATATQGALVKKIHAIDPTSPTTIGCAAATITYKTGSESPTSLQVNTLGNTVTINGPTPSTFGNKTDKTTTDKTVGQGTLDSLYTGTNQPTCAGPGAYLTLPSLSMGLLQSEVDRGGTVTAVVHAGTTITSVTITWGDTTQTTQATYTAATGVWRATHVYTTTGTYTVTASATVSSGPTPTSVTASVTVIDAPPVLGTLTVTSTPVAVMATVTVSGRLTNPNQTGLPVTATITWGDGSPTTQETVPVTGTFSFTHVYERLVPPGSPTQKEPITVTLKDSDNTTVSGSTSVTVEDVKPTGLISPTSGGVVANQGTNRGTAVFTHAGTPISWTSEVSDVSPFQGIAFSYTWGDGTTFGDVVVTGPTPSTPTTRLYTYPVPVGAVSHAFADPGVYTVTTTATDADTLSATPVTTQVVVTAPLGFTPVGSGFWQEQFAAAAGGDTGGTIGATALGRYLEIAAHLSPGLAPTLTPTALTPTTAAAILDPSLGHLPKATKLTAELRQELLTVLLDFANGSWNWTQEVGPDGGTTLQAIVAAANTALTSGTSKAMKAALHALLGVQATPSPTQLTWTPSTNGIFSFTVLPATTTATQTFTLTSATATPIPAVTVGLAGSPAFTITANTCPTVPSPTGTAGPTTCEVTVAFTPTASDTPYSATFAVRAAPSGTPNDLVVAELTVSGTST